MEQIITNLEQLHNICEPLEFITDTGIAPEEGEDIISKIKEIMSENSSLLALSAPQIGINKRIFCIKFNDAIKSFINPIITKKSGATISPETFSSMPGKEILISRPNEITVVYYTDDFKYEENKLIGAAARLFDQQAQLLDGILPDALGLVSDVELDGSLADCSEEEIKQLTEIYKQFIETKKKALEDSIQENEEETKQYQHLKFTEKVINGDIQVVESDEEAKAREKAQKIANQSIIKSMQEVTRTKKAVNQANLKNFLAKKGK